MTWQQLEMFRTRVCDAGYVGYTTRLHQLISKYKYSAIGRHMEEHGLTKSASEAYRIFALKKCRSKFDCLVFHMLFIKELSSALITQKDSIRAKHFTRVTLYIQIFYIIYIFGLFRIFNHCLLCIRVS